MQDKIHWAISIISLAACAILFWHHFADREKKIAYIDTSRLVEDYKGMIEAKKEYQEKAAVWAANVDTLKKEVETMVTDFEKNKNNYSVKEKKLQEQLIRTKQEQLAQYREAIANKAKMEDNRMTREVVAEINAYINAYGQRKGYDIIIGATQMGNLAFAKESLDVTEDLLKELNGSE